MKKHEYAQAMGLCEEAVDNWDNEEHPDRLNDTTTYGDCCFCGKEIIGFVCVDDDLGLCHPDCPREGEQA